MTNEQNPGLNNLKTYSLYALLLLVNGLLIYYFEGRKSVTVAPIIISQAVIFSLALFAYWQRVNVYFIIASGVLLRLCTLAWEPNLSEDYVRYYWDSSLYLNDFSIFENTPTEVKDSLLKSDAQCIEVYDNLNSKNYYSIYPGFIQATSLVALKLSNGTLYAYGIVLKSIFILFDCFAMFLLWFYLKKNHLEIRWLTFFAINPLFILDVTGNLHYDLIMMYLFFTAIILLWYFNNYWLAALLIALSFHTKMLSILLIPFFTSILSLKNKIVFYTILMLCILLIARPFIGLSEFYNLMQSVRLYFQTFEFNASIYFVLRYLGNLFVGYNTINFIGPLLKLFFALYWTKEALTQIRTQSIQTKLKGSFSVLLIWLLLSTTVHSWYVATIGFLGILIQNNAAIFWTLLAVLSYETYYTSNLEISTAMLWLEYGTLFGFILYSNFKKGYSISW